MSNRSWFFASQGKATRSLSEVQLRNSSLRDRSARRRWCGPRHGGLAKGRGNSGPALGRLGSPRPASGRPMGKCRGYTERSRSSRTMGPAGRSLLYMIGLLLRSRRRGRRPDTVAGRRRASACRAARISPSRPGRRHLVRVSSCWGFWSYAGFSGRLSRIYRDSG